ncbi:unnamed protein product, partial [Mesorhabditis belari]|uniref:glutathione transferase n=1 Tax=Mesorhabditis belari TaxID=2138241 RepID=A0AAF3FMD1_9BILA
MYFSVRARGEPARLLFALAGVPFEDHRLSREDWKTIKPTTPYGQIPVLFVDEKPLAQSRAIYRYLGNQFGYSGENEWDSAQIDALGDEIEDFRAQVRPFIRITNGMLEGDLEKSYNELVIPATDSFFPIFEKKYLELNQSGFLIGSKVSWADLFLAELVETFTLHNKNYAANYPKIRAHREKVYSLPGIKEWIEKRPKTSG